MHNLSYLDMAYEILPDEIYKNKVFDNIENNNFVTIFNFVYNIFVELFKVKMENILLHKQLEKITNTSTNSVVYVKDNK